MDKSEILNHYNVSRETLSKFEEYGQLLTKWQRALNIVSRGTIDDFWSRHLLDSLQLMKYIPEESRILDVGSGGGFPGMVLAMSGLFDVTCVDSDTKKTIFLEEVARITGTHVTIMNYRIENITEHFDVITARGFSSLDNLIDIVYRLSASQGVFLKGKKIKEEIESAQKKYDFKSDIFGSETSDDGNIIVVKSVEKKKI